MDFILNHLVWTLRIMMLVFGAIHALRDHFMKRVPDSIRDFLVSPASSEWWTNSYAWHYEERYAYAEAHTIPIKELWYDKYPPLIALAIEQILSMGSDAVHALGTLRAALFAGLVSIMLFGMTEALAGNLSISLPWWNRWYWYAIELFIDYGIGFSLVWGPTKPLLDHIPRPELTKANAKRQQ